MEKVTKDMHERVQSQIQKTHELFCLRDSQGDGYGLPQAALNSSMFIRELSNVFKNPDHPITKWSDKFEIHQCGYYNYSTGEIIPTSLRFIGMVSDFKDVLQARASQ